MDHLSSNKLSNTFQSDYLESHSTETTLLSVNDNIIGVMSVHHITVCLLDFSAAFDAIDHTFILFSLIVFLLGFALFCLGLHLIVK